MSRRRIEAHIWLDPVRRSWTILDGRKRVRTGFYESEELEAEQALRQYLYHEKCKKDNNPPPRRNRRTRPAGGGWGENGQDLISLADAAKNIFGGKVSGQTLLADVRAGRIPGWDFSGRMFTSVRSATELYEQSVRLKKTDLGKGVYVIGYGDYVKIGITQGIRSRLESIQTGIPEKIKVYAMLEGWRRNELMLHKRFAEYRTVGEWFRKEGSLAEWINGGCE